MNHASLWAAHNLRGCPFAPDPLGSTPELPTSLLVDRVEERQQLPEILRQSAAGLWTLSGNAGVGKTSLAYWLRDRMLWNGYICPTPPVPLHEIRDATTLERYILVHLNQAVKTPSPDRWRTNTAPRAAQALNRLATSDPAAIPEAMWRVRKAGFRGVFLLVDGAGIPRWPNAQPVVDAIESLYSRGLGDPGWQVLIDGPTRPLGITLGQRAALAAHLQILAILPPFPIPMVAAALEQRYASFQLDPTRPVLPPLDPAAIAPAYVAAGRSLGRMFTLLHRNVPLLLRSAAAPRTLKWDDLKSRFPAR